jgi:hypothetical protein
VSSLNVDVRVCKTGLNAQIIPINRTVYFARIELATAAEVSAKIIFNLRPTQLYFLQYSRRPSAREVRQKYIAKAPNTKRTAPSMTKNCKTVRRSIQRRKNMA